MRLTILLAGGGAGLALAAALGGWLALAPAAGADPSDPAQVARGQAVYADFCASCHGADLEGQPDWKTRNAAGRLPAPPHDVTGHTWHHPDAMLFDITKNGIAAIAPPGYESDMPGFGEALSDDDIWAALAFIKSRWPAETLRRQQAVGG
ncbi:MAG: cytochrome c [Rhodospirillales bacterium]|nr:cytochrome c [Rhodospirillales bacterium]